ncbi:AAA family ATPase [Microbispora sp. NPDC049125]|uniref:methylation-associated defense system AAA family ATPase MAD3 n=1 Tax=Microbispora sp. NPDC049125 TaxID=3154929 RepID=UPI003467817F
MITRIEVYGYRCFAKLSIGLDRYHVLAGTNGAGKTTLLDIPTLLGELLSERRASTAFLERQRRDVPARATTITELLHKGQGNAFAFAIEARLPDDVVETLAETSRAEFTQRVPTHLRYELRLGAYPRELAVADEHLFLFSDRGDRPAAGEFPQGNATSGTALSSTEWQPVILREVGEATRFLHETTTQGSDIPPLRVPPGQLALGAVPADPAMFPAALWFASLLREGVVFFSPDWNALRRPAPPGGPKRLEPSGVNVPWLALDLQASDPERFASWIDHVRTALPQVEHIEVIEREEDHHAYFAVEYAGGYRVTSSGLSEGTLRILALTLLPYLDSAALPTLLVTEEPENGIHPRAIETVVQSLSSLYDSQVWVSTHSPIVLAHTDLPDVLAARLDGSGGVSIIRGDRHPQLRDWQGSLDIGTLFAAGVLS